MEIKHQVFVSSTYKDLADERKEVIHALLELDCIPAGMELFPATDEDAWSLIKEIIDDCDYYILILAGKYGSINNEGIGFTEMEYNYALETNKPIISFLHDDIDSLPTSKSERSEKAQERLNTFREKVKQKHCKFWSSPHDLGGKVSRSLVQLKKRHPSNGWVPGQYAADTNMLREIEEMRVKLTTYEAEELISRDTPPPGSEVYEQGEGTYTLPSTLTVDADGNKKTLSLSPSWDKLFSYCGSALTNECNDEELEDKIQLAFWHSVPDGKSKFNGRKDIVIPYVVRDAIKIQLQALGLMEPGIKKRAVSDTRTYWKMTSYGSKYLIQISAIRRN